MTHRAFRYALGAAIFVVLINCQTIDSARAVSSSARRIKPTQIIIPTAKVNAEVINIGITKSGNLDVPPNYYQAGWYKYGVIPGEFGNAVIDGHVDNGKKVAGPFKNLKKVKVGDDITVVMNDGSKVLFTITDASVFNTKAFPAKSVFHGDGRLAVLKIITCHGNYIEKEGTYDHRLIVTAVKKDTSQVLADSR